MSIVPTSLKLPRALKQRLEQYADDAERKLAFVNDALAAEAGVLRTGKALLLDEVEAGLLARARG